MTHCAVGEEGHQLRVTAARVMREQKCRLDGRRRIEVLYGRLPVNTAVGSDGAGRCGMGWHLHNLTKGGAVAPEANGAPRSHVVDDAATERTQHVFYAGGGRPEHEGVVVDWQRRSSVG
jgi:hypothetical protein